MSKQERNRLKCRHSSATGELRRSNGHLRRTTSGLQAEEHRHHEQQFKDRVDPSHLQPMGGMHVAITWTDLELAMPG